MFAVSDAMSPSGFPLPKVSLFFDDPFASPYETILAILPPAPGKIPIKVPIKAPRIASNFFEKQLEKILLDVNFLEIHFHSNAFLS